MVDIDFCDICDAGISIHRLEDEEIIVCPCCDTVYRVESEWFPDEGVVSSIRPISYNGDVDGSG